MTIGLGFIFGNRAYLAADKRTTHLNADGSNRSYLDGSCKVFMLSSSVYAFCGGVVQATKPLMAKIIEEFSGKDLNENHIFRISQLCRDQYNTFIAAIDESLKTSTWIKDFVLSVIVAQNIAGTPRLIRYDIEDNFEPVIQSDNGAICIKSAIAPEVLWPEIQKISNTLNQKGFSPEQFIANIFLRASELDMAISPTYDLFTVSPIMEKGSYSFQKIGAGTITATISITSPVINGGKITGATFDNGNGTFRVTPEGILYASQANISGNITGSKITGTTISGGTITGATFNNGNGTFTVNSSGAVTASNINITGGSINVRNTVYVGGKIQMNPTSFNSEISFCTGVSIDSDPATQSLFFNAIGGVWAGGIRLDAPNYYAKSYGSQDISFVATDLGVVVRVNETAVGSLMFA